jgi:GT2 family glycosyltransferase
VTSPKPKIAVVVASHDAAASVEDCLTALRPGEGTEIVVVDNSTDGTREILRRRFPEIPVVERPPSELIPELWGTGIRRTTAEIVAITTAHCVPGPDWIARMLKAHAAPVPAVGGAVESHADSGLVDWAVYFCRYSAYMLPFPEGFALEIAGDNASYKRAALDRCEAAWRDGFFEPAVHAELKQAGEPLLLVPSIVVTHRRSFGFRAFLKARFRHGVRFGIWRAARLSGSGRALRVLVSPAVPLLMLLRIARLVFGKRRHRLRLLLALPVLFPFLLAWVAGEAAGYLRGR